MNEPSFIFDSYWTVKFSATNNFTDDIVHIRVSGEIDVVAKDIFEALKVASEKVKTFGYDNISIDGATVWSSKEPS